MNNARVGVGLMDNAQSGEDYRAASLLERINIINNTFSGNRYAITGGDNLVAVNNIFAGSTTMGIKNIDGNSIVAHNMFWNNAIVFSGSNVDSNSTYFLDPIIGLEDGALQFGSPAIDAGIAQFTFQNQSVFNYPAGTYFGSAPDLGWIESNYLSEPTAKNTPTITPTSTPRPGDLFTYVTIADTTINADLPTTNYGTATTIKLDFSPLQKILIKFFVDGISGRPI